MSPVAADQLALLRALHRHGVEFVVLGGVAAQTYGWQGATADLDIAISRETSNFERLSLALASVDAGDGFPGGLGTTFRTRYGRLEIVTRADGIGGYDEWLGKARRQDIEPGLAIVVAGPEDILRSKEASGREKDIAALPQMRRDFRDSGAL